MRLSEARRRHIAGAYAVGTLRGPARRWVERRLMRDAALCAAVDGWQDALARWVDLLAPVAPRDEVWHALERRIGPALATPIAAPEPPPVVVPFPTPLSVAPLRRTERLAFWRAGALAACAAALVLAVAVGMLLRPAPGPTHTAVIADPQGRPVWIIDAHLPEGGLAVRALPLATPPPGKAYELWMLPAGGQPVSLGVLPAAGARELRLAGDLGARLQTAAGIAVSLEPPGGSPTHQPTGPVVYQAVLVRT